MPAPVSRLRVRNASKRFGALKVLDGVDLEVSPGEIHALLGHNGSGKSTLIKILSGYLRPEAETEISFDDRMVQVPVTPKDLRTHGVAFVHQDLGLCDSMSVLDNIRMGRYKPHPLTRRVSLKTERAKAQATLDLLGSSAHPSTPAGALPEIERARVAIARALQDIDPGRGLIVFDEASRSLPQRTASAFYDALRRFAAEGGSVLFVSHRLDEVLAVADRATLLRDGRVVEAGMHLGGVSEAELTVRMLGREVRHLPTVGIEEQLSRPVVLSVRNLSTGPLNSFDLDVHAGEIVGVSGIPGSGVEDLPYVLSGARSALAGTMQIDGRQMDLRRTRIQDALAAGVVLVPERRDRHGLVLGRSIRENVSLPRVRARSQWWRINRAWEQKEGHWVLASLGINTEDPTMPVGRLSGGNQQRVLMGKWLLSDPRVLVLHEPTQGVDVGARRELLELVCTVATVGCAVLIVTGEPDVLAAICDRVVVVSAGRIAEELDNAASAEDIVAATYGERT